MAAYMNTGMILSRSIFILQSSLKIESAICIQYHAARIHSSSTLCRRRPLRRKAIQVFLPEKNKDGLVANTNHNVNKPNVGPTHELGVNTTQTSNVRFQGEKPSDTFFTKRDNNFPGKESSSFGDMIVKTKDLKYEKASVSDKRFGNAMTLAKNRKMRDRNNRVVLEGYRLVHDALLVGATCHTIFFSIISNLEGLPINKKETELVKIPYKDFEFWSDLSTPQGIVGVFNKPSYEMVRQDNPDPSLPLTLICDNIRDPGNLGTIIRAATAANCEKILVTVGCVDIWDPKVLRAGAGAHFHMPISGRLSWSGIQNYLDPDTILHLADTYQLDGKTTKSGFHQMAHSDLDWTAQTALVIGGETEGISPEAEKLCQKTNGSRLFIPMSQAIDSLNAAMSATVMLFEAKRQWLLFQKKNKTS